MSLSAAEAGVMPAVEPDETLLQVRDLVKNFPVRAGFFQREVAQVQAVSGISFDVGRSETLGLVGESGCGKSTTGRAILNLQPATAGSVTFQGRELVGLSRKEMRPLRRDIQLVFQDPYASLNPRLPVFDIVAEPLRVHRVAGSEADVRARVREALAEAGMTPVDAYLRRLPFELSGGQRQRVAIAAALALRPHLLVADEPVSMLDVSIRAEILNLLRALADDHGIAVIMITHDLSTVAAYADRIAVMYLGRIVESGDARAVLDDPQHPYTQALRSVVPVPNPAARRAPQILSGEMPDPSRIPRGCRFHPRCPLAFDRCVVVDPPLYTVSGDHLAACLLVPGADDSAGPGTSLEPRTDLPADRADGAQATP
jgi:peptide/nickel transport system ATP-binding protein/oligopeptide transport system ATP-binding protein